jgi:hypothetical protein
VRFVRRGLLSFSLLVALVAAASFAASANAAELITRNANNIKLQISPDGKQALVTYTQRGAEHRTLAWGAINALPSPARKPSFLQTALKLDYSGGYKSFHLKKGQFKGGCTRYDGPTLHWVVAACKASDGSYWALQNWQRALPNYGVAPSAFSAQYELWLSHWKGALPVFEVGTGWSANPGRAPDPAHVHSIFGRFTYLGKPIFGYGVNGSGAPTDTWGRVLYVDTYNSQLGTGWRRENSFVTHNPFGTFCYGFFRHGTHPNGMSLRYRITAQGPGVLPDMYWEGASPGAPGFYDQAKDLLLKQQLQGYGDPSCG